MRRKITVLVLGVAFFAFSGCSGLKGKISNERSLESKDSALPSASQNIVTEVTVGLNLLDDKRPQTDVSYMTSVREKVSTEFLNSLKGIQFFKDAHLSASESDDVVIGGEVRKFNWQYYNTMISYIPGLNVLPFFGLTSTRSRADVEIYLEFKNNKTKEIILKINESFTKNNSYNIYSFNPNYANSELAACFDVVLNKIKDKVLLNKNKILEAAKVVEPPKISKPVEDKNAIKETKPVGETRPKEDIKPAVEAKPAEEIKPPAETNPSLDSKDIIPQEGQKTQAQ